MYDFSVCFRSLSCLLLSVALSWFLFFGGAFTLQLQVRDVMASQHAFFFYAALILSLFLLPPLSLTTPYFCVYTYVDASYIYTAMTQDSLLSFHPPMHLVKLFPKQISPV